MTPTKVLHFVESDMIPKNPEIGSTYWNKDNRKLYVHDGEGFKEILTTAQDSTTEWQQELDLLFEDQESSSQKSIDEEKSAVGKFKVGDKVSFKGRVGKIIDDCGTNKYGLGEYCIEFDDEQEGDPTRSAIYVDENDIHPYYEPPAIPKFEPSCTHEKAYLNKISTALQFWVCPDCKQEITDKKLITELELDRFLDKGIR